MSRLLSLLLLLIAFSLPLAARGDAGDWQSLFDGRTLVGWEANAHPQSFTVNDGTLKAHGKDGMAHLFVVDEKGEDANFVNFELECVCRAEPDSNSGIFFHTGRQLRKGKYLNKGYELQLNSTAREPKKTGSLYAVVDLDTSPVDETEWFAVRLKVEGKRIRCWLDDQQVLDYTEPENPERPDIRRLRLIDSAGGTIALQAHDPGSVFYFKNLRIRRLP